MDDFTLEELFVIYGMMAVACLEISKDADVEEILKKMLAVISKRYRAERNAEG